MQKRSDRLSAELQTKTYSYSLAQSVHGGNGSASQAEVCIRLMLSGYAYAHKAKGLTVRTCPACLSPSASCGARLDPPAPACIILA